MSAVAEVPLNSLPTPSSPNWLQRLSALDRAQRMRLGVGVALLVAAAVAAIVLGRQPDYRVLFANLNDKDGGAIVAQLSQMNVPYKHAEGGGAILIPADRVHDVRLRRRPPPSTAPTPPPMPVASRAPRSRPTSASPPPTMKWTRPCV